MNQRDVPNDQLGPFLSGMIDVLFAFAFALEGKGLMSRAELAEVLRQMGQQLAGEEEGRDPARHTVPELMLAALDAPLAGPPVRDRWRVILGGAGQADAAKNPRARPLMRGPRKRHPEP